MWSQLGVSCDDLEFIMVRFAVNIFWSIQVRDAVTHFYEYWERISLKFISVYLEVGEALQFAKEKLNKKKTRLQWC